MRLNLVKQPDISGRDTLNYQNNCRNTFGWLVGLSYEVAKLDILIILLKCVDGRFSKIRSYIMHGSWLGVIIIHSSSNNNSLVIQRVFVVLITDIRSVTELVIVVAVVVVVEVIVAVVAAAAPVVVVMVIVVIVVAVGLMLKTQ